MLSYYANADPQAGAATALFIAGFGADGYASRRDPSALARTLFWALIGLIVFGILFVVPDSAEGPVLVSVSAGHGLSLVDVAALVPLLAGTALLAGGLWRRRQGLDATPSRRPWLARAGAVVAGLGLGLFVASVFAFF